jgi:hypothetical protein
MFECRRILSKQLRENPFETTAREFRNNCERVVLLDSIVIDRLPDSCAGAASRQLPNRADEVPSRAKFVSSLCIARTRTSLFTTKYVTTEMITGGSAPMHIFGYALIAVRTPTNRRYKSNPRLLLVPQIQIAFY